MQEKKKENSEKQRTDTGGEKNNRERTVRVLSPARDNTSRNSDVSREIARFPVMFPPRRGGEVNTSSVTGVVTNRFVETFRSVTVGIARPFLGSYSEEIIIN